MYGRVGPFFKGQGPSKCLPTRSLTCVGAPANRHIEFAGHHPPPPTQIVPGTNRHIKFDDTTHPYKPFLLDKNCIHDAQKNV